VNGTITVTYKWTRRIAISIIGGSVLLVGLAMTVLPGPAIVVIPLGLGILGLEFAWARRWLRRVKERAAQLIPGRFGATLGGPQSAATGQAAPEAVCPATRPTPYPPHDRTN